MVVIEQHGDGRSLVMLSAVEVKYLMKALAKLFGFFMVSLLPMMDSVLLLVESLVM